MSLARILSTAAVLTAVSFPAFAERLSNLNYTVLRNGDAIGTHTIALSGSDGQHAVRIDTDIKVKIAFITAYKFLHSSTETWADGRLVKLSSETDDDGTAKKLDATSNGGSVVANANVQGSRLDTTAPADVIPASLWNSAIVEQTRIMNTLDGHLMTVSVTDLGEESVAANGRQVSARHFRMQGDLERDLWFDTFANLVRVQFKGADGSDIVYALD